MFWQSRYKYLRKGLLHLILSAIILLGFRLGAMGSTPAFAPSDNPASDNPSVIIRSLTFLYLPVFNFWLLVYPRWLSFDWSMEAIPLIQTICDSRNIATLIFYSTLIVYIKVILEYYYNKWCDGMNCCSSSCNCAPCCYQHHHHSQPHLRHMKRPFNLKSNNNNSLCSTIDDDIYIASTNNNGAMSSAYTAIDDSLNSGYNSQSSVTRVDCVTLSLMLMIIPFLPATNLCFYVGFVVAERILYIPSFGYCLLIAIGVEALMRRKAVRFITTIALSILLISFSMRTFIRNIDWLTEENLYRSGIAINPPKGIHNLIIICVVLY